MIKLCRKLGSAASLIDITRASTSFRNRKTGSKTPHKTKVEEIEAAGPPTKQPKIGQLLKRETLPELLAKCAAKDGMNDYKIECHSQIHPKTWVSNAKIQTTKKTLAGIGTNNFYDEESFKILEDVLKVLKPTE
jgi:hypothetical protein